MSRTLSFLQINGLAAKIRAAFAIAGRLGTPVLFVCLAFSSCTFAQVSGQVGGRVLDPSGAAITGAQVGLISPDTDVAQSSSTTNSGNFVFFNVVPGTYRINVSAKGFTNLERTGITVITGKPVNVDIRLSVGSERQTVTVDGDAPLLQSTASNISTNIPGRVVSAMPLNQ